MVANALCAMSCGTCPSLGWDDVGQSRWMRRGWYHPKRRNRLCERVDRKPVRFHTGSVKSVTSQFGTLACSSFFFSRSLSWRALVACLGFALRSRFICCIPISSHRHERHLRGLREAVLRALCQPLTEVHLRRGSLWRWVLAFRFTRFYSPQLSSLTTLLQLLRPRARNCDGNGASLSVSWFRITLLAIWAWDLFCSFTSTLWTLTLLFTMVFDAFSAS